MSRRRAGVGPDPMLTAQAVGLVVLTAALMAGMGWLWAGPIGVAIALAVAAMEALLLPAAGPSTILRVLRAYPLPPLYAAELYAISDTLARRAGLPAAPRLFITSSPAVEAMAVAGARDDAAVVLSAGALRHLSPREMAGVLGHEISHLAAGDVRLFRLVGAMAASVRTMGVAGVAFVLVAAALDGLMPGTTLFLLAFIAGPLIATLAEAGLWRLREYAADDGAVSLTGDAQGLATALHHIETLHGNPLWRVLRGLRRSPDSAPAPLRSHPQTRDRIARLLSKTGPPAL